MQIRHVCPQVRTKTFVAVGHESANNVAAKDHMQANLLANMDLGGNQRAGSPRTTTESIQMQQFGKSDDPSYQMRGTNESDDAFYSRGPLQVSNLSSQGCTALCLNSN